MMLWNVRNFERVGFLQHRVRTEMVLPSRTWVPFADGTVDLKMGNNSGILRLAIERGFQFK
jgi:hypothetical protein